MLVRRYPRHGSLLREPWLKLGYYRKFRFPPRPGFTVLPYNAPIALDGHLTSDAGLFAYRELDDALSPSVQVSDFYPLELL